MTHHTLVHVAAGLAVAATIVLLAPLSCITPELPVRKPGDGPVSAAPTPEKYQCTDVTGSADPWLIEWQGPSKQHVQEIAEKSLIVVNYKGCDLEILRACKVDAKYVFKERSRSIQSEAIRNVGDIYAKIRIGAVNLAGSFKEGDEWRLEYVSVGTYGSDVPKLESTLTQKPGCEKATHYVSSYAVGAYQLVSAKQTRLGAEATLLGQGGGGQLDATAGLYRKDGDYNFCTGKISAANSLECQAILKVFLEPVSVPVVIPVAPPKQPVWSPGPVTPVAPPVQGGPKVAAGAVTSASGTLIVHVKEPANAYVEIKGPGGFKQTGVKQLNLPGVKPGSYTVALSAEGYEPKEETIPVPADEVTTKNYALDKLGGLRVTGTPVGAKVSVTGPRNFSNEGGLPWSVADTWLGQYTVKVTREGYEPFEQSVTVAAGAVAKVVVNLVKGESMGDGAGAVSTGDGWVQVPGGSFMMGCSPGDDQCSGDEKPAVKVTLKGFRLMAKEVTQGQYQAKMGNNPSRFQECGLGCPVEVVTWHDAKSYCEKIGGRLPTEAEWEYAARAGNTQARYGDLDAIAWYSGNSGGQTHPVGEKKPNAWGLYDMLGNVWEWTESGWSEHPGGTEQTSGRVNRGGGWYYFARHVRASLRYRYSPDYRGSFLGFRCAGTKNY